MDVWFVVVAVLFLFNFLVQQRYTKTTAFFYQEKEDGKEKEKNNKNGKNNKKYGCVVALADDQACPL